MNMKKASGRISPIVAAVALILAAILALPGCAATSGLVVEDGTTFTPTVYISGDDAYMLCGKNKVRLGSAEEFSGDATYDSGQLFYKGDFLYCITSGGEKKLMRAASDASAKPETIATNVDIAQGSEDGSKVLYVTGVAGTSGTLYLWEQGKEPAKVADSVLPTYFDFSPQAKCFYYLAQEDGGYVALYVVKDAGVPSLVTRQKDTPRLENGVWVDSITNIFADDEGSVLFSISEYLLSDSDATEDEMGGIYLFSGSGESEKICTSGQIQRTLGSADEFLYYNNFNVEGGLYYKAPGSAPVRICGDGYAFFSDTSIHGLSIEGSQSDREFMMVEFPEYDDEYQGGGIYDVRVSGETVKIAETDYSQSVRRNTTFNCVLYVRSGCTYAAFKTDTDWKEQKLSDNNLMFYLDEASDTLFGFDYCYFDEACERLYYIDSETASADDGAYSSNPGPLYACTIATGETEKLMDSAWSVFVSGNNAYATAEDGSIYRIAQGSQTKVTENIYYAWRTRGGDYFIDTDGLYYLPDGSTHAARVMDGGETMVVWDRLQYSPSIEQDPVRALGELNAFAEQCMLRLDGIDDEFYSHLSLEEAKLLAEAYVNSLKPGDAYYEHLQVFIDFKEGFAYFGMYQDGAGDEYNDMARHSLQAGMDGYQSIWN